MPLGVRHPHHVEDPVLRRLVRYRARAVEPERDPVAGLVASLTFLIIHLNEKERSLGTWQWVPAIVLVFLSAMMVSTVKYPSFKGLGLRSSSTFAKAIIGAAIVGALLIWGIPQRVKISTDWHSSKVRHSTAHCFSMLFSKSV